MIQWCPEPDQLHCGWFSPAMLSCRGEGLRNKCLRNVYVTLTQGLDDGTEGLLVSCVGRNHIQ